VRKWCIAAPVPVRGICPDCANVSQIGVGEQQLLCALQLCVESANVNAGLVCDAGTAQVQEVISIRKKYGIAV
jgi:hypothetical protein